MTAPVRTKEIDDTDSFSGLTSKQYRFVMFSFSGLSDVEAYRQSYGTEGQSERTIWTNSAALAHNPLVVSKLRELRLKSEQQATLAPLYTRAFVLNGIASIALTGDKDSTRLRAYELMGKTKELDIFSKDSEAPRKERTLAELDADLKAAIANLRPTLEVDARPVEPAPAGVQSRKRKPRPGA